MDDLGVEPTSAGFLPKAVDDEEEESRFGYTQGTRSYPFEVKIWRKRAKFRKVETKHGMCAASRLKLRIYSEIRSKVRLPRRRSDNDAARQGQ